MGLGETVPRMASRAGPKGPIWIDPANARIGPGGGKRPSIFPDFDDRTVTLFTSSIHRSRATHDLAE